MLDTPHSMHLLLWRPCWQMLDLPHSIHMLLWRWCWQKLDLPHSLHWLLWRWCWQMLDPPQSLHLFLMRWCWQRLDPPHSLHLALVMAHPVLCHVCLDLSAWSFISVSLVRFKGPRRRRLLTLFGVSLAFLASPLVTLSHLHPVSQSFASC